MRREARPATQVSCDDDDQRLAAFAPELLEQADDVVTRALVEVAGGLVGEDHLGLAHQRPGDGHTLLFAAAELRRDVAGPIGEADAGEGLGGSPPALVAAHVPRHQRRLHVLLGGQRRDEVERLEDEAVGMAPELRQVALAQLGDVAAFVDQRAAGGTVESAEHLQQRRLAGAGGSLDHEELAVGDLQVDCRPGRRRSCVLACSAW